MCHLCERSVVRPSGAEGSDRHRFLCLSPLLSVIFSLGPACGCLLTMSSYSNFDRNCHRDAIIIAVCNCGTSVFCGIVVFSALGFIAHDKGVEIEEVE